MNSVLDALEAAWPVHTWSDVTVVVAVSGGADSVALLRAVCQARPASATGRVFAAHFNHALRPEADDDEAFVAELAQRLETPLMAERASDELRSAAPRAGLESAARQARYAFLHRAVARCGARYLATAHTASDQAETVLHRIIRGAGLKGLAGIPPRRPIHEGAVLVRPLLTVDRTQILGYLRSLGQPYQVDPSNENPAFTRNRLRRGLLPLLREQYNPKVDQALCRLGGLAAEAQYYIERAIEAIWDEDVEPLAGGDGLLIKNRAATHAPFIARELLRRCWRIQGWPQRGMSFEHWQELAQLLTNEQEAALDLPGGVRAQRIRLGLELRSGSGA